MNKQCGIYEIFNIINGKSYIGQSTNITQRLSKHKTELKHNKHQNLHLQNAWNKYGEYNFIFNVIEYCDIDELDDIEKYYINVWNLTNNQYGYNIETGGHCNKKLSQNTKQKIRDAKKGCVPWNKGKTNIYSKKTLKTMSDAKKGKSLSESTKNKISKANNTTGFYRVRKIRSSKYKKGFYWDYRFYDINNKRHRFSSVSLLQLEKKVKTQNLLWQIIDKQKAQQSLKEDMGE